MKIVFLDAATVGGDVSLEPLRRLGELVCWQTSTPAEALERVREAEVLIINKVKVDRELVDAASSLKLICEAATGVNNIDVEYAAGKGIPVKNVTGYSTESVVQLTFMHVLNLVCKARQYDGKVKSGDYSSGDLFTDISMPFRELAGKRMGIIGMGTIGRRVAAVAAAFGMEVRYFSTSGTSHCHEYPSVTLERLLSESDIVSIHAPLNEATKSLIGAEELEQMKPDAILLNMGRGGIVDESALVRAVDSGVIAGAAADVFETEPLPPDHPFLKAAHPERLSFSPHIGWASIEARERLVAGIARNIENYIAAEKRMLDKKS